jgi:hypothetical protein
MSANPFDEMAPSFWALVLPDDETLKKTKPSKGLPLPMALLVMLPGFVSVSSPDPSLMIPNAFDEMVPSL